MQKHYWSLQCCVLGQKNKGQGGRTSLDAELQGRHKVTSNLERNNRVAVGTECEKCLVHVQVPSATAATTLKLPLTSHPWEKAALLRRAAFSVRLGNLRVAPDSLPDDCKDGEEQFRVPGMLAKISLIPMSRYWGICHQMDSGAA